MMSSYDDGFRAASAATAARVGADLRGARERLGWTLPAMAAHLRIRLPFLEALEDGRTGDLPGNAYAIGFLRTYAQALGLDPDEIARRFRAEAAEANRKTELNFPAPVPDRGIPAGALVLVGGLIAIGAYIGWYRMSGNNHAPAPMVQTVPERLAPLVQHAAPAPPPVAVAVIPSGAKPADAPAAAPPPISPSSAAAAVAPHSDPLPVAAPAPTVAPVSAGAATPSVPPPPAAPPSQAVALAPPVTPPVVPVVKPDGPRIVIRAKADAWVQVRDKGGPVLLNRILHAGETWQVPAKATLLLTTGNAQGTEVLVDGVLTPSLGADGVVRRDLPLDPEAIKDGKLAPVKHP